MKILHISSERSWRGGEQQIAYLIKESLAAGLNCRLLLRGGSAMQDWAEREEVPYHAASISNALDISSAMKLKEVVKQEGIDLIHIHSGKGHDIYALAYLLGLRTKTLLSRRVDFPVKSNPWARWKYNLPSIKRIICVSDAIRVMTAPALSRPQRAVTVHSGVDTTRFAGEQGIAGLRKQYSISADKMLIGNVSALAPHKDLSTFVLTAQHYLASHDDARFLLIGEGEVRPSLEHQIKNLGLEEKVMLVGFRKDIPEVLQELDIFLITSKTEGLGTTVLDAFASNLPVVATAAGGLPESVIDGETGMLRPVGNVAGLSKAIEVLVNDANLRHQLASGAKEHLSNFSKEETARKTIAHYTEVLRED